MTQEAEETPCPFWAVSEQVCHDPRRKGRPDFLLFRTTRQETLRQGPRQPPRCPQLGRRSLRRIPTPRSFEDGPTHSATHLQARRGSWICRMGRPMGFAPLFWGRAPANSAGESKPLSRNWNRILLSLCSDHCGVKSFVTSCYSQYLVFRKTRKINYQNLRH